MEKTSGSPVSGGGDFGQKHFRLERIRKEKGITQNPPEAQAEKVEHIEEFAHNTLRESTDKDSGIISKKSAFKVAKPSQSSNTAPIKHIAQDNLGIGEEKSAKTLKIKYDAGLKEAEGKTKVAYADNLIKAKILSDISSVTVKKVKKGDYKDSDAGSFNNQAIGCRQAVSSITGKNLLGDQTSLVEELTNNAVILEKTAEKICTKVLKESKGMVNKLAENQLKEEATGKSSKTDIAKPLIEQMNKSIEASKGSRGAMRSELRNNAHIFAEKAASSKIDEGKVEEGMQIRSDLVQKLGHDSENVKMFTTKSDSPYGINFSDKAVGGDINVDHRIFATETGEKNVTTIRTTLDFPTRDNILKTLKSEPSAVVKGLESALPEIQGKVVINTEDKLVLRKKVDAKRKVFDSGPDSGMVLGKAWTMEIKGIGKLSIPIVDYSDENTVAVPGIGLLTREEVSRAPCNTAILNNVYLEMNGDLSAEDKLKYAQGMLAMVGAGPVFENASSDDKEKIKLMAAFTAFYPREAESLQLKESTSNLTFAELESTIMKIVKKMPDDDAKTGFTKAVVTETATADGRKGFIVNNVSQVITDACEKAKNPVAGLMAGVGGAPIGKDKKPRPLTDNDITVAGLILKHGFMSSLIRMHSGGVSDGASPGEDIASGAGKNGEGGVFFRGLNNEILSKKWNTNQFTLGGTFQFIVSMDVLNEDPSAYAKKNDQYGWNDPKNVMNCPEKFRPKQESLTEFFTTLIDKENEVVLSGTAKPQYIRGIVVKTQEDKDRMRAGLERDGLVVKGMVNGIPIENFIHVSDTFKKEMWQQ